MTVIVIVVTLIAVVFVLPVAPAIIYIVSGVGVPIRVDPFPIMKTRHAEGFTTNPDVVRPQIVVHTADDADVFVTVPDVIIRIHVHRYHRRRRFHGNAAIRADHAAGNQGRDRQN